MSLITAELATSYPLSNSGFLGWTKRAFGDAVSFLDGYIMTLVVMIDQALYPVIFVSYVNNIEGVYADDPWIRFGYCVVFIGLSFIIAMLGVGNVGIASNVFGILTLAPFLLFVIIGIAYGNPDTSIWFHKESDYVDLPLYLSVLIWACCGYEYAGFLAADVKNPGRTFPMAMTLVVVLMMGTYILPIAIGIATYPADLRTEITDGYYPVLADHLGTGRWLGYMMLGGALLSNLGTYISYLQTSATGLREMARDHKAPQLFRWFRTFKQPVMGMLFYSATTLVLVNFDFGTLVEMETMLYAIHIIVVACSLVRLRWKGFFSSFF
jgi:amino acid transporter